ncbi:MAG TPA: DUF6101 family protein [Xanthobacteraceae bacterium]|jgi:hypothetical protein|nr:DUF6101 family protein [Xanthobacteraceae bacterium]
MSAGTAMPAGSSRALRLDPSALPVSFAASDARADERLRHIELGRERVVVRRAVRGIYMRVSLKVAEFLGVAVRVIPPDEGSPGAVGIFLEHRDQGLSVPLFVAADGDADVVAEWQRWARVLGLPLLIADGEGFREPFERIGAVRVDKPTPRRRSRSILWRRRPSILRRRKPGRALSEPQVHRGEREIIARN